MSLEHILLGMLAKPATGYDLKAEFEGGARLFWSAEFGQIYPTLHALEKQGLLKSVRQASEKGPPRKVYHRTARGDRQLREWLEGEPVMGVERFAYIAQLIFLGQLGNLEQTEKFVQRLRDKQATVLGQLHAALQHYAERHPDGEQTMSDIEFHEWLALQLGTRAISGRVQWCDEIIGVIRQRRARETRTRDTEKPS